MGLLDLIGHKYPETSFHELNLDWCITAILQLQKAFEDFSAGNKLVFANPLQHDLTKTYAKNTIVVDSVSGSAYLSLSAVPVGVQLDNVNYWLPVFDFAGYVTRANQNFTDHYFSGTDRTPIALAVGDWVVLDDVLYKVTVSMAADDLFIIGTNIVHFTVEQFLKEFITSVNETLTNWYNQMTGTINQYKNDIDTSEANFYAAVNNSLNDLVSGLQAQIDAILQGATVDSEVIDARVGADGITYPTLGDAIRTQFANTNSYLRTIADSLADGDNIIIPLWHYGYINGSDGSLVNQTYNATNRYSDKMYLKKGSCIARTDYAQVTRIYEYDSSNVFVGSYLILSTASNPSTAYIDHDGYYRINQAIASADATPSFDPNDYISITRTLPTEKLLDFLNGNKVTLNNAWDSGYISGSDGSEGSNSVDARTKRVMFLPEGSSLNVTAGHNVFIHYYDEHGTWTGYDSYNDFILNHGSVTDEDLYIRIVFNDSNGMNADNITKLCSDDPSYHCYFDTMGYFPLLWDILQEFLAPAFSQCGDISAIAGPNTLPVNIINGHIYLVRFKTSMPLNQTSFYLQIWQNIRFNGPGSVLLKNFGNVWTTEDSSDGLSYIFIADNDYSGYFRFGYNMSTYLSGVDFVSEIYDLSNLKMMQLNNELSTILNENSNNNYWKNKRIVWFGTSIPTGGDSSYPKRLGRMLGATVENESTGSSAARIGHHDYITDSDIYGYAGVPATCCLLSLSGTRAEKQDILDNWVYWSTVFTQGVDQIDTSNPDKYLNSSYETKLNRYLFTQGGWPADLYVFDHGCNDAGNDNWVDYSDLIEVPSNPLDRTYFIGAMNFLIDKIKTDDYKAKIVIISHYNDEGIFEDLVKAQKYIADKWNIPFINISNKLGFSTTVSITVNGTTKTMKDWYLPDGIHPTSDTTGYALQHYADVLFPEIRDVR